VLVYRCAPARSRVPWAWWACCATSVGLASLAPAPVTPPPQLRDGLARETRSVCAGHERAASARDRSYTISHSKRYCR
jgi:hypothetical protein